MTSTTPIRLICAATLGAAAFAPALDGQAVRDSAGVRIVTNTRPQWTTNGWRLRPEPLVDMGIADGKPENELHDVVGATQLSNGVIVVASMATANLRYYDASGHYLHTAGRPGQGPGEFEQLTGLAVIRGDTVIGSNSIRGWEVFTGTGRYVRSTRTATDGRGNAQNTIFPKLWLSDGSAVGDIVRSGRSRAAGRTRWIDSMTIAHLDHRGAIVSPLPALPAAEMAITQGRTLPVEFGPGAHLVSAGDKLYFMFGNEYAIRVMSSDGKLEQRIRRTWTPRRIVDAERKAWVENYTNPPRETLEPGASPARIRALRLRNVDAMTFSPTLPALGDLLVDTDRNIWVREAYVTDYYARGGWAPVPDSATQWSVFSPAGTWLGDVTMPTRFRAIQIGRDAVLGLFRDDDDVQHVRLYRIDKP